MAIWPCNGVIIIEGSTGDVASFLLVTFGGQESIAQILHRETVLVLAWSSHSHQVVALVEEFFQGSIGFIPPPEVEELAANFLSPLPWANSGKSAYGLSGLVLVLFGMSFVLQVS